MGDSQLGWSETQWQMVNCAVAESFKNASVVGQLFTPKGPLAGSAENVREELLSFDAGRVTVKNDKTKTFFNLTVNVELSSEQVADDQLTSALLAFRRAASALALAEDFFVFNGYNSAAPDPVAASSRAQAAAVATAKAATDAHSVLVNEPDDLEGLSQNTGNDGSRSMRDGSRTRTEPKTAIEQALVSEIADGIASLEGNSHPGPFACVLGHDLFVTAHNPTQSMVMAADRITPLLGGPLLRSSRLEPSHGIVLSQGGDAIDLVVATPPTIQFLQRQENARFFFRVYERFRLRVKDKNDPAVIAFELQEKQPSRSGRPRRRNPSQSA